MLDVTRLLDLTNKTKLPDSVILRLFHLLIYSHMEGKGTNPGVHKAYRIEVKRKLYIRCMRSYGELFKGKKELL